MDFFNAFAVLNPSGVIAFAERSLMVQAVLFMLIVAVPVYVLLFFFAWYYRAQNKKATYLPNWEHAKVDELIWWAIPLEIVLILGALTWTSTHALDPRKALSAEAPALVVQVVALDWKWLFLYPEQEVATVGYLRLPLNHPVRFEITADAPMNSFWIPSLSGQIYAMTGMVTALNVMASQEGVYEGGSANYSGDGFAHMRFAAEVSSQEEFQQWALSLKSSSRFLDFREYQALTLPSIEREPRYYSGFEPELFDSIVAKFNFMGARTH